MIDIEPLYIRLPTAIQTLSSNIAGLYIQQTRFGAGFGELLRAAHARSTWSAERIEEYRNDRLREFVRHCARTVPYYQRQFRRIGLDPDRIRSFDDLRDLPILRKHDVTANQRQLASRAVPRHRRITAHTSGTTGSGLRFATTQAALQEQWAIWWRYRLWHGIEFGTWSAHFGGRLVVPPWQKSPPYWRVNWPGRQVLFSGFHLSPQNMSAYVDELRRRRLPWLHGYPSALALIAAYVLETGYDLGYQVDRITVGAENLLPQQRDAIENAFGVRPRQHYGMAEAVANISECEQGSLHVDEDFSAVEFIPATDGSGYRVVGTNFSNLATPMLRYDTEDVVTLADSSSCCGRPGRIVRQIDGRHDDYVILNDGTGDLGIVGGRQRMESRTPTETRLVDPVDQQGMKVDVQVERVAETLDEGDGAALAPGDTPLLTRPAPQRGEDRADEDAEHRARETRVVGEPVAQREGEREHPLPDRHLGKHAIDQVRGGIRHTPAAAGGTEAAALAGEAYDPVEPTLVAVNAHETVGENAAAEVGA